MRIVLHIGQQKTGSTAIQMAFSLAHDALAQKGILYPFFASEPQRVQTHGVLLFPEAGSKLPRGLVRAYGRRLNNDPCLFVETFNRYCRAIEEQIERYRPEVLVLSSELLFRPVAEEGLRRLKDWLDSLSKEQAVVAYVRRPRDAYLSQVQQRLRSRSVVPSPNPICYRATLERYRASFGHKVSVVPYMHISEGHDIVQDFTRRFVPELNGNLHTGEQINTSSTAEIMSIMSQTTFPATSDGHLSVDTRISALENRLREIAAEFNLDTGRAILRPEVADHVDRISVDLIWLREVFGVVFETLNYTKIDGAHCLPLPSPLRISDICKVDQNLEEQLLRRVIKSYPEYCENLGYQP